MSTVRKLAITLAATLLISLPAQAEIIPSVASGEAADREAALTSALRHAVEQVVGMSVSTSTYVSNLKSIQDKVYTGAVGYIASYTVVGEQRTPTGYRVTVSAQISKEKLVSDVAPLVGGEQALNGQLAVSNLRVGISSQKDAERTFKTWLDELTGPALSIAFSTSQESSTSRPDHAVVYFEKFRAAIDRQWYRNFRSTHRLVATSPFRKEVFTHAREYFGALGLSDDLFVADLLDDGDVVLGTYPVIGAKAVKTNMFMAVHMPTKALGIRTLVAEEPLPLDPPDLVENGRYSIQVPISQLKDTTKIRVRLKDFRNWPVKLD